MLASATAWTDSILWTRVYAHHSGAIDEIFAGDSTVFSLDILHSTILGSHILHATVFDVPCATLLRQFGQHPANCAGISDGVLRYPDCSLQIVHA